MWGKSTQILWELRAEATWSSEESSREDSLRHALDEKWDTGNLGEGPMEESTQ